VHHKVNNINMSQLDPMQKRGSKCINSIAVSYRLLPFIEGCKLLEINEVIAIDYHSYIIDINLKEYF